MAGEFSSTKHAHLKMRYNRMVHVISRRALVQFWDQNPACRSALVRWYAIVSKTSFDSFAALRTTFPSADLVDRWIVFNIGGNKCRLVASVHFNRNKLYVRHVLTHRDYDKGDWKSS